MTKNILLVLCTISLAYGTITTHDLSVRTLRNQIRTLKDKVRDAKDEQRKAHFARQLAQKQAELQTSERQKIEVGQHNLRQYFNASKK